MRHLTLFIFLTCTISSFAQDAHFSQINQSKIFFNPAFAGSDQNSNLLLNHKNYSPENFGNYLISQASYNQKINPFHGGIGAQIINDRQGSGTFNRIFGSIMYSYHFQLQNNIYLYAGLESKLGYLTYNTKDLIFPDMFNRNSWKLDRTNHENFTSHTDQYLEFNAGILMVYKNYMLRKFRELSLGIAVHHLNNPGSMLSSNQKKIPRKYNMYFDIDIPMMWKKETSNVPILTPIFFVEAQSSQATFQYGGIIDNNSYKFGVFSRHNHQFQYFHIILYAGFNFSNYSLHYSYDGNIFGNMQKNIYSGAHEVTFTVNFQYKGENKKR